MLSENGLRRDIGIAPSKRPCHQERRAISVVEDLKIEYDKRFLLCADGEAAVPLDFLNGGAGGGFGKTVRLAKELTGLSMDG